MEIVQTITNTVLNEHQMAAIRFYIWRVINGNYHEGLGLGEGGRQCLWKDNGDDGDDDDVHDDDHDGGGGGGGGDVYASETILPRHFHQHVSPPNSTTTACAPSNLSDRNSGIDPGFQGGSLQHHGLAVV